MDHLAMFIVEFGAGLIAHSTALLADSVDMLGDAIVYGFSLYVIGKSTIWQARGALLKGSIMGAFAVGIAVEVAFKLARGVTRHLKSCPSSPSLRSAPMPRSWRSSGAPPV